MFRNASEHAWAYFLIHLLRESYGNPFCLFTCQPILKSARRTRAALAVRHFMFKKIRNRRRSVSLLQIIRQCPKRYNIHFTQCGLPRISICHNTGKLRYLGNPAPVFFSFKFNYKRRFRSIFCSHHENKYTINNTTKQTESLYHLECTLKKQNGECGKTKVKESWWR